MKPTLADIIRKAAKMSGYTVEQIKGEARNQPLARTRFAIYKVANSRGYAYARIGRELNKDHTSVRHGAIQCEEYTKREPQFAAFVSGLHIWAHQDISAPVMVSFGFDSTPAVVSRPCPQPQPYRVKPRNWFDNSDTLFEQNMKDELDRIGGSAGLGNGIKGAMTA